MEDSPTTGGYSHKFTDPVLKHYICPICTLVQNDSQQTTCCGKTYCRSCLEKCKDEENGVFYCPGCASDLNEQYKYFPDKITTTKIKHLRTHCVNMERGCKWVGYLKDLLEGPHRSQCPNEIVECTNQKRLDQCRAKVQRRDLHQHMTKECEWRIMKCLHCDEEGTFNHISTKHLEVCPQIERSCGNKGCSEKVKQFALADHHDTCPKEVMFCPYHLVGCKKRLKREDVPDHVQQTIGDHLDKALLRIQDLEAAAQATSNGITIKLHIPREDQEEISTGFYAYKGGFKIALKAKCTKRNSVPFNLQLNIAVMQGQYDSLFEWPAKGKVRVKLLNQKEDRGHKVVVKDVLFQSKVEPPQLYGRWTQLCNFIFNSFSAQLYSLNDVYYIRVTADPIAFKSWLI